MRFFKALLFFVIFIILLNYIFPIPLEKYSFKYSKIYYSDNHTPIRMKIADDKYWRFYCKNEDVPLLLKNSIINFEDKYFYSHFGVNIFSIFRTIYNNIINNSTIGASTISMQVVKIVEPKERTYFNKLVEIFRAIQLEIHFTKDEILNIYFNKAPYGGNIEGLRSASYFYFNKELDKLSISEMAILTTIPKNPNANRPDKQKNLGKKRDKVLEKLKSNNLITEDEYNRAKKEPIYSKKYLPKFEAIQYTNRIRSVDKTDIQTTINYKFQKFIQEYLKAETTKFNKNNIYNSACIVIDNKTLEIKAYIGSNDFFDNRNGSQNDGVQMKKSPGSTLKPFVYALALDEGLITPKRKLLDIPMNFNGYKPKNYHKTFVGEITMEEALKLSLNIPAIDLQNQLEDNSLYEFLEKLNIGIKDLKTKYGLSIVVGGIDLSLEELTKLYTIFAKKGVYGYTNPKDSNVLSPQASFLISQILSQGYRYKFSSTWNSSPNSIKIAFKTGTSSDAKHLYTIGYNPNYTIGLWFGNFDGKKTVGEITGSNTVSNALIEIFNHLDNSNNWFEQPKEIKEKEICPDYFSQKECSNKQLDFVYTKVNKCMQLTPEKIDYLTKEKGISLENLEKLPCYKSIKNNKPIIETPIDKNIYIFNNLVPKEFRTIKVLCKNYNKADLTLVLNEKVIQNNTFLNLEEGFYKLNCSEDKNRFHEITFQVKLE